MLHFLHRHPLHPYAAELIATFSLTLGVTLSLAGPSALTTPVTAALIVGMFVYTIGPISGAHINPAVTFGMLSVRKIGPVEAVKYILAQCFGAILAMGVASLLLGGDLPQLAVDDSLGVLIAEVIGAAILVFGVSAVAFGKIGESATGAVVGGSLLAGIAIASTGSLGILNPAVAMGLNALSLFYLAGPLLGGLLGAQIYRWLVKG